MINYVYIVTAILLLCCIFPMPYGYYTLVRLVSTTVFGWLAYRHYKAGGNELFVIICVGIALLFQPFVKIPLGRGLWNFVDVVVAIFLLYIWFNHKFMKK